MAIRLLIADDHKIVREGLFALLQGEQDLQVVGEAEDGEGVVSMARALGPDVVIMDISLRGLSGLDATARLRRELPSVKVLVLSMHDDPARVDRALLAGARGYLVKGRGIDSLVEAVRMVHRGELYLDPDLPQRPLPVGMRRDVPDEGEHPLTAREREILTLLASGLRGPQIAERLGLSAKTVENHRARIMDKLGIRTTAGLVRYALTIGLL